MLLCTESLQFTRIGVLDNIDALVNTDAVVQCRRGGLHLDRAVRDDFWSLPATCFGPVNAEHVIREKTPKHELFSGHRLDLAHIRHLSRQICHPEGILCGRLRLHRAKGSHEHGGLKLVSAQ